MLTELKKFRHQIVLDILDFSCPHEVITQMIGVEPTYAHVAGEKRTASGVFPRSNWALYSFAEDYYSEFDEHVESFLGMVEGRQDAIQKLHEIAKVEITVLGIFKGESRPAVHFNLRFLAFLNQNGIPVDIDFGIW